MHVPLFLALYRSYRLLGPFNGIAFMKCKKLILCFTMF